MAQPDRSRHSATLRAGVGIVCLMVLLVSLGLIADRIGQRAVGISHSSGISIPECEGARALDTGCLSDRYEALTRTRGAETALAELDLLSGQSGFVGAACHQLTHVVGRTAGELNGLTAFTSGSEMCASGYYHGVVEAVMQRIDAEEGPDQVATVCDCFRAQDPFSFPHYNCVHGMGHGFMGIFQSDVFRSLEGCDGLVDPWEQQHCFSGVFMENLTAITHLSRPSIELRPDAPLYPCTAVAVGYKHECYLKQTAYALYVNHNDFGAVFRLCRDVADFDFRAVCEQGLGGDAAIFSSKFVTGELARAATVRQLCLLGADDEARANCVVGAVTTGIRDLSGDDAQARSLCAALQDLELATVCEITREEAKSQAALFEAAHRH
jgi:hypothetical protein